MAPSKVLLIACGSFNPPTLMHLRMFEVARDTLKKQGIQTIGGVISPVHDGYGKEDLAKADDRLEMVRLSASDSDWIRVSDWECQQTEWSFTVKVLQHHQNALNVLGNEIVNSNKSTPSKNGSKKQKTQKKPDKNCYPDWLTSAGITAAIEGDVKVILLCGADMFETFIKPGLWRQDHVEEILGQFGVVVLHREGCDPHNLIYESDLLHKYQANITVAKEWIANNVSSTKIRRAVRRGDSVKYLVHDKIINTILDIYTGNNEYEYMSIFPTPSPNDIPMESTSPTTKFLNEINSLKVPPNKRPPSLMIDKCAFPGQAVKVLDKKQKNQTEDMEKIVATGDDAICETKVEIQITKDGIKVISDKETTV